MTKKKTQTVLDGKEYAKSLMLSIQNHWTFGIRSIFFLVPLLLWYIDPILFILATLTITMYFIIFQDIWTFRKHK